MINWCDGGYARRILARLIVCKFQISQGIEVHWGKPLTTSSDYRHRGRPRKKLIETMKTSSPDWKFSCDKVTISTWKFLPARESLILTGDTVADSRRFEILLEILLEDSVWDSPTNFQTLESRGNLWLSSRTVISNRNLNSRLTQKLTMDDYRCLTDDYRCLTDNWLQKPTTDSLLLIGTINRD